MPIRNTDSMRAATRRPAPLWRNRDYVLLWLGQAVSSVGGNATELALPLLVLSLTHSPAQAGFVGALREAAYLILGLPAGALVDRWDRKRVMRLCDTGRALALGSIPLALVLNHLTMVQLYLVSLVEGILYVFFTLAETACLPQVVAREQLPAATAQNEVTGGVATLLGPSLGGTLYGIARGLPFLADAVSYAASVFSLLGIRTPFQETRATQERHLRAEIRVGLVWLWRQRVVRAIALLTGGLVFATSGMTLLVLVVAEQRHVPAFAIGLMFGIGGIGGILGALLGTQAQRQLGFGRVVAGTFWLFALLWPLYAIASSPLALGAVLAAFWLVDEVYDVVQVSYRLAVIPDALRGRVAGAYRLITYSCLTLGKALTGILLQRIGVLGTIELFALGFVLLALAATLSPPLHHAPPAASDG
jgi:MFS family permease